MQPGCHGMEGGFLCSDQYVSSAWRGVRPGDHCRDQAQLIKVYQVPSTSILWCFIDSHSS